MTGDFVAPLRLRLLDFKIWGPPYILSIGISVSTALAIENIGVERRVNHSASQMPEVLSQSQKTAPQASAKRTTAIRVTAVVPGL
jgi:hypothetical protein